MTISLVSSEIVSVLRERDRRRVCTIVQIPIVSTMAENGKYHYRQGNLIDVTLIKSMNISLPDSMRTYVKEQLASGGYSTFSEYFRELVRQDRKRKATKRLETLLLEGLDSGTATSIAAKDWEDIRQAVRERIAKLQG